MKVPNQDREKWRRAQKNGPTRSRGELFASSHGRFVEIKHEPGDQWAADLVHYYGCTRIALKDTRAATHAQLVEHIPSFPRYLGYYLSINRNS